MMLTTTGSRVPPGDDFAVRRQVADTVSVMKDGRIVEDGTVETVFHAPAHAYTRELIDAIPGRAALGRVAEPVGAES